MLTNFGAAANIAIQVTATNLDIGDFGYTVTPPLVLLERFQNIEVTVSVRSLSRTTPTEGPAIRFVVTATADDDNHGDRSDFLAFDVLLEKDVRTVLIVTIIALQQSH